MHSEICTQQFIFIKISEIFPRIAVLIRNDISHGLSQAAAYGSHLEAMRQPVVYKHGAGQGKYLRFILQPSECG